MGLIDVLNGMQNGPRGQRDPSSSGRASGGMSPITMAILGLLAYKAVKGLAGGQPSPAPANTRLPPGTKPTQANTGVPSGQNPVPGWRADRRARVGIGENHAFRCQPIHVRCRDFAFRIQTGHIPVSHVIGYDVHDVGKGLAPRPARRKSTQSQRRCPQSDGPQKFPAALFFRYFADHEPCRCTILINAN